MALTMNLVSHRTKQRAFRAIAMRPTGRVIPGVAILCYHSLDPANPRRSATPQLFSEHIDWLRERYDLVTLADATEGRVSGPRSKVAITFDDGFADQHAHALPVLADLSIPATFFLTTGRLDGIDGSHAGLRSLDAEGPGMSWGQARELVSSGMGVGAHTHTHPNLALLDGARAAVEMETSRDRLRDRLGVDVTSFAYPYGRPRRHHTDATRRIASASGFESAVAIWYRRVVPGMDRFCLPRFAIQQDDLKMLGSKIDGRMDVIGRWQSGAPSWAVRAIAGKHYR
jgi:peptidoglycan/xylan/chitin deacetylase (PgdA/CDA1 family)